MKRHAGETWLKAGIGRLLDVFLWRQARGAELGSYIVKRYTKIGSNQLCPGESLRVYRVQEPGFVASIGKHNK